MRSGRLLAEESPQVLLSLYKCQSLEDVFLKLSRKQGQSVAPPELNIRYNNQFHCYLILLLHLNLPTLISNVTMSI